METERARILVLGAGNLLMSDDGVGVHVIRRLLEVAELPKDVQVLDGGTLGLNLLYYLQGVSRLVIVDAMETGQKPGSLRRLAGSDVPAYFSIKMSPHQVGLPDMLQAAKLQDLYPEEVVIWGVQPVSTEVGLDLSPEVSRQVNVLVDHVLEELRRWGVEANRRA